MRTVYQEKKYTCGEYLDVFIYPVYETGKHSGGKRAKRKPSTEAQKKLNQRRREEKLTRLLHANFTPEDLEIHLTYRGEQPGSDEEAARNMRNYIRRIQRLRKKLGLLPLKYIAVTEQGKKGGRYHHHITVNGGIDRDTLEELWESGCANSRRLQFDENGLAGLGHYIVKSPVGGKAWSASKNLVDPEPRTRDGRISGRKAKELAENKQDSTRFEKMYPGYLASGPAEAFHNDVNEGSISPYASIGRMENLLSRRRSGKGEANVGRVELPGGGCVTESEALTALVVESKRRSVSYGKLVADTNERERAETIRDYCAGRRRKARKNGKRVFHRSSRPGYHGILFPCKECEEAERRKTMEKRYCGRPEQADEEGCPMENPNEEMQDCGGCRGSGKRRNRNERQDAESPA